MCPAPASSAAPAVRPAPAHRRPPRPRYHARPARCILPAPPPPVAEACGPVAREVASFPSRAGPLSSDSNTEALPFTIPASSAAVFPLVCSYIFLISPLFSEVGWDVLLPP